MRGHPTLLSLALLLLIVGCQGNGRSETPEAFADRAVAAVAREDFAAFHEMSPSMSSALAKGTTPLPTQGLGGALESLEQDQIKAEFERVVRSQRLRGGAAQTVVTFGDADSWILEVQDTSGQPLGVQIRLRGWNETYRVVGIALKG